MPTQRVRAGRVRATTIPAIMKEHSAERCDLIKIDIEGGEAEVFSVRPEAWLARKRALVIDLHHHIYRGSAKAFYDSLGKFDFDLHAAGENLFLTNLQIAT